MIALPRVHHRRIDVDGVEVFYRESVPDHAGAPVLLLLHGFPSASHQFRRLIDVLGGHYRLVADGTLDRGSAAEGCRGNGVTWPFRWTGGNGV